LKQLKAAGDPEGDMRAKLLYISGSIAFAFAILHCSFWVMFDWAGELPRLSAINAAIVQMLNIATIFVCFFKGFISFVLAKKQEPFSVVEKSILVFVGGSSFLRAAFGFPLFGISLTEIVVVMLSMSVVLANVLALKLPGRAGWR
jgi:hypothetical protein